MSGESFWTISWPVFGLLAVEVALLVSIAGLISRRVTSAAWRRTVWQGCILALLGLLALEISGSARYLASVATGKSGAKRQPTETLSAVAGVRNEASPALHQSGPNQTYRESFAQAPSPPPEVSTRNLLPAQGSLTPVQPSVAPTQPPASRPASQPSTRSSVALEELAAWLVLAWLCGALVLIAINALARASFAWLRHRGRSVNDPAIRQRVEVLASRMGLRRRIRLFESPRLIGPIATGVLRPAIGLPARFASEHTLQQQDVMLAHEVAHLAANDPLWSRLADILAALLWWHPLAWWARKQLHAASETAADESSLLVGDGPRVLAECLVALGGRLTRRPLVGGLGVEGAGFRSALGRRVERLLQLPAREWAAPRRLRCLLARTLAPAALVAAVIFCTAWTVPQPSTHGDRMKNPVRSLPLYALLAALYAHDLPADAADATKPAPPAQPAAADPLHPRSRPAPVADAEGAAKLKAKLDAIVLDQVTYDGLPLGEVVRFLIKEAAAKDPEKVGVNFLFGQPTEPISRGAPPVDPATGLPIAGAASELPDLNSVTIRIDPPIKKVRLIDALDAIKRVADVPITYTVEGYAVVLTFDAPRINSGVGVPPSQTPPPPVVQAFTRSFKLDTNIFFVSLQRMFRHTSQIDPSSDGVGEHLQKHILSKFGVKWNATENIVLYNPLTAVLLVRASQADLDIIRSAIETLGGAAAESDPSLARGGGGGSGGRGGESPAAPKRQ